ncbi:MAG: transglycosylase SLT domain-containing protein [Bacteroidia bacterium]
MTSKTIVYFCIFFFSGLFQTLFAQDNVQQGKIEVRDIDQSCRYFIQDNRIYSYGLDTMSQVRFWRTIIKMSPDSGIMNLASNRLILKKLTVKEYNRLSDFRKDSLRSALRTTYLIPDGEPIFFSSGKNDFYNVTGVMSSIDKGIRIFENENTDPFYAQAILLIESPGKCSGRSYCGATGSFQLMRAVAKNMGLQVNKNIDERKDFDRSAWAAAKLIRTICIPYTNKMLEDRGIAYDPSELWYRLLILHVYHAGAGNVARALDVINTCDGNIDLIKKLWQTRAGNFGLASQNYSQVALANLIELDKVIKDSGKDIRLIDSGIKTTGALDPSKNTEGN